MGNGTIAGLAMTAALTLIAVPAAAQLGSNEAPSGTGAGPAPAGVDGPRTAGDQAAMPWNIGVSPAEQELAQLLYAEANKLVEVTSVAAAVAKYRQALEHWDHPMIRYNLAMVLMEMERPIEAYDHLVAALRYGQAALGRDNHKRAMHERRALQARLVSVSIRNRHLGVSVSLDGRTVLDGPGAIAQLMQPGEHQLVIEGGGFGTLVATQPLWPDRHYEIAVDPARAFKRRWRRWIPGSAIAAGAGLSLAGGFMHWRAESNFDSFDREVAEVCPDGCQPGTLEASVEALESRAELQNTAARVFYAMGGAVLVTGAVLLYLNRSRRVDRDAFEIDTRRFDVTVAPAISARAAGVFATGRF